MRTNIVINDDLMARVMEGGDFKTKREAVEEGLRLLARRKAYAAILAARGTFVWDDSDAHWAQVRAEQERQGGWQAEVAGGQGVGGALVTGQGIPAVGVREAVAPYVVSKSGGERASKNSAKDPVKGARKVASKIRRDANAKPKGVKL